MSFARDLSAWTRGSWREERHDRRLQHVDGADRSTGRTTDEDHDKKEKGSLFFAPGPPLHPKDKLARDREWNEMEEEWNIGAHSTVPRWELKRRRESTNGDATRCSSVSSFRLSQEMLVRHRLQSRWTLCYLKADRNKE
ncbi:hypothetical protein PRIPAC_70308 [Pristionchus pacificus]|uniref:Uncharacterized protein n=1 Tax=Pristionchus pacificus TaxID=54126 RepID=A0A2A6CZX3_PRIPA|nr:hypothetical protein PRIPAC_70308 [Pristionchus pacificus]|eukprot:PDM83688.1 hypothetical protein PRIPAC_30175 [Pristionchus pacificus]